MRSKSPFFARVADSRALCRRGSARRAWSSFEQRREDYPGPAGGGGSREPGGRGSATRASNGETITRGPKHDAANGGFAWEPTQPRETPTRPAPSFVEAIGLYRRTFRLRVRATATPQLFPEASRRTGKADPRRDPRPKGCWPRLATARRGRAQDIVDEIHRPTCPGRRPRKTRRARRAPQCADASESLERRSRQLARSQPRPSRPLETAQQAVAGRNAAPPERHRSRATAVQARRSRTRTGQQGPDPPRGPTKHAAQRSPAPRVLEDAFESLHGRTGAGSRAKAGRRAARSLAGVGTRRSGAKATRSAAVRAAAAVLRALTAPPQPTVALAGQGRPAEPALTHSPRGAGTEARPLARKLLGGTAEGRPRWADPQGGAARTARALGDWAGRPRSRDATRASGLEAARSIRCSRPHL